MFSALRSDLSFLHEGLDELGCRALLVLGASAQDPELVPLMGSVRLHRAFVIVPKWGEPHLGFLTPLEREEAAASGLRLLTPEALDVARWARDGDPEEIQLAAVLQQGLALAGLVPGRVALGGRAPAGIAEAVCRLLTREGWDFTPGHSLLRRVRKRKSPGQLSEVRRVARGTVEAFWAVARLLSRASQCRGELRLDGRRLEVGDLRREVGRALADRSLDQPEGNIVAAGVEGAVPHTVGDSRRVLRSGESIVVDLYPRGWMFADCARTFCVGEPPTALVQAHEAVRRRLAEARSAVRPGVSGWQLHELVCRRFEEEGFPTSRRSRETDRGYLHGLGHGVGFELHEYPSFGQHASSEGILQKGDVFTLEPGLYDAAAGYGVRLEDLFHMGDGGLELLTPLPYDLDPGAWLERSPSD
jgi:Xaa-Pro aminopeptidase